MSYCRECGKIIEDGQKECPYCGTEVNDTINIENHIEDHIENRNVEVKSEKDEEEPIIKIISDEPIIKTTPEEEPTIKTKHFEESPSVTENKFGSNQKIPEKNTQPLNNWIKVTLSVLISALPGIGSLIGIIAAIIFMTKEDEDRKTFGYALLTYSIIYLIFICTCCMIFAFGFNNFQYYQ
ncbi:MAG: hypothetical protein PWP07_1678 [Epulopiscium sp.]|uniref:zinc-ribbon domain-containing protein n=1 Tax=Defluviitalea raffinosedens TaxID=1450156 RepID=UPI00131C2DE0|nr:zinc ribbon domain-containing protein [Defluviitalea raffinosedens]MBM7686405.1 putative membrane protein [Defluviitalea raffinosedens]MBZ4667818.1 zinc-ribbon domain [Defluviitaleaceae bacterium]MDK2788433.1 hypothetical protein [Candidatus Epulonipiscium sp.]